MITGWIIQPQIDKLSEQRKQLDSLRVDMKVEIKIIKHQIIENTWKAIIEIGKRINPNSTFKRDR